MSSSTQDPTNILHALLQTLQTLYHDPSPEAKRKANEWLEEFQHSVEAWQTGHNLLTSPESPLEGRLFAAQTLRAKILYDFDQLPPQQRLPLRDSLLSALIPLSQPTAPPGSRAVLFQLCLALSDLGLQTAAWENVVGDMIAQFGKDPGTVGTLLGFLKAWVEESMNHRIRIAEGPDRVGGAAEQVLSVLVACLEPTNSALTPQIKNYVFETLSAWLQSGEVTSVRVVELNLFEAAYQALDDDFLFDAAVDVICDLIHETQELADNSQAIDAIAPRIMALGPQIRTHAEDSDRVRGYCRIFCEAGECYKDLILRHPAFFLPLVQDIAACAAYPDLDIVPITFNFWYVLATAMGRQPTNPDLQPVLAIYQNLQSVIIGHLHFPADNEQQTPQERDEFRSFRHRMGDTLKDCCHVLGAATCLKMSYDLVVAALSKGSPSWQEIEAPLFSMRSMGAEVDPDDDEVLPHIMDLLPRLPEHPRIRYAAILVISRYTQWIDRHPDNLAFQLQYISAGFEMAENEVSAAAAQAMKFMCQDCAQHLVPFLPQLHAFISTIGDKLDQSDLVEVYEAIGYVILGQPADQAAPAIQQFLEPLIQRVQTVASAEVEAQKPDLQKAADALEQMDALLSVIRTLDPVPESCFPTAGAIYQILDTLLARYAKLYYISERVGSVLRRGLAFFPARALERLLQPVLERMAIAFEQTGYASYLWIIGKSAAKFGEGARGPGGDVVAHSLGRAFESVSHNLSNLVQLKSSIEIPDVMDDYVHCFVAYLTNLPTQTLSSPIITTATALTLSALTCPAPETTLISLDALATLSQRLSHAQFQPILQPVFASVGKEILNLTIRGIVQGFPEDGLEQVQEIVGATVLCVPAAEAAQWAQEAVGGIPNHIVPVVEKNNFLRELNEHLAAPGTDRLKNALNALVRAARRARERGRQSRKSLGTGE